MKILQFSGGKDSLACLYLLKNEWDTLKVVWVNAGAAYPETLEYMEYWKKIIPNFVEIRGNQPEQIALNGYPSDIVPINDTVIGREFTNGAGPLVQSYLNCCAENIWLPMVKAIKAFGATEVIRGQRQEDNRKSKLKDGEVIDGVKYTFPIFDWSEEKVFEYLSKVNAYMPKGYALGEKTGRDCWDCTAYLDENLQRIKNLPNDKRDVVLSRLNAMQQAISKSYLLKDYGDKYPANGGSCDA